MIIEGRIGALGSDQHDMVYGIPKNSALNSVASVVPGTPSVGLLPELALAKRAAALGAAKLALFAYERESREPVWQSGLSIARSSARDTWFLGIGPIQHGTIHRRDTAFNGTRLRWRSEADTRRTETFLTYERPSLFAPSVPTHHGPPAAPTAAQVGAALLATTSNLTQEQEPADVTESTPESSAPGLLSSDQQARPLETEPASAVHERPVIHQVSAEVDAAAPASVPPEPAESPESGEPPITLPPPFPGL